jgi:hypothetical protein
MLLREQRGREKHNEHHKPVELFHKYLLILVSEKRENHTLELGTWEIVPGDLVI